MKDEYSEEFLKYHISRMSKQDEKILLDIYEAGSISVLKLIEKYTVNFKKANPDSLSEVLEFTKRLKQKCRELVLIPTDNLKAYGFITVSKSKNNARKICVLTEQGFSVAESLKKKKHKKS